MNYKKKNQGGFISDVKKKIVSTNNNQNDQGDNFTSDKNGARIAQAQRTTKFHYVLDLLKEVEYQIKALKNTKK